MKKTYIAPSAERIALETEEILEISFTGIGTVLEEKTDADKKADIIAKIKEAEEAE